MKPQIDTCFHIIQNLRLRKATKEALRYIHLHGPYFAPNTEEQLQEDLNMAENELMNYWN